MAKRKVLAADLFCGAGGRGAIKMPQQKNNLTFTRSAENGHCAECGARTCMRAIVRNNKYPYTHKVFKCAKCIKKQKVAIEALNVGDTYTDGKMVVRVDDVFMDIVYASVFEAVPPYDCVRMCAKSAQQIIAELTAANATKWKPPKGRKLAMPFWKKAKK